MLVTVVFPSRRYYSMDCTKCGGYYLPAGWLRDGGQHPGLPHLLPGQEPRGHGDPRQVGWVIFFITRQLSNGFLLSTTKKFF